MGQVQSTSPIDLGKYSGRWFEIARYPNPFEQGCYAATADYIQEGQELVVVNTCYHQDNSWKQNIGRAQPVSDGLIVSFNYSLSRKEGKKIPIIPGEYRVLWTDYQTFSFVAGGPFYWILSRKPIISREEKRLLVKKTIELGYGPKPLIWNRD